MTPPLKCQCVQVYIDGTHNTHCQLYNTQVKQMKTIEVELPAPGSPWVIHRVEPYLVVVVDTSLAEVRYPNAQNVVVEKQ